MPLRRSKKNTPQRSHKGDKRENLRLSGTRDLLPSESKYWDLVNKKASELAKVYGFQKIEIPVLENIKMYKKVLGKKINEFLGHDIYTFLNKANDKVVLRPSLRYGMARAHIEHGMQNSAQPVKLCSSGPVFEYARKVNDKNHQMNRFDMEIFGEAGPMADALLISIAYNFFKELQINIQVQINSIGDQECGKEYLSRLMKYYKERGRRGKLCMECKKIIQKNPMALLECVEEKCADIKTEAPQIIECLQDPEKDHFTKVLEYLDEMDINYNFNPFLVRSFDNVNRTVFEFWPFDDDGNPKGRISLGGGGRYDRLIESMGGEATSACGIEINLERTVAKIREKNISLRQDDSDIVFVAQLGEHAKMRALSMFDELRRAGYNVRQSFTKSNLKLQLEDAKKMNARISLILGKKEESDGTILFRDMESGVQETVIQKKLNEELDKKLNENLGENK